MKSQLLKTDLETVGWGERSQNMNGQRGNCPR